MLAGITAPTVAHVWAWLQSDAVRVYRARPTRLDAGSDAYALIGGQPVVRVAATDADADLFPTGERTSPQDDLTFAVTTSPDVPADAIWLLQQVPPGQPLPPKGGTMSGLPSTAPGETP
jgi:hypothetical protein